MAFNMSLLFRGQRWKGFNDLRYTDVAAVEGEESGKEWVHRTPERPKPTPADPGRRLGYRGKATSVFQVSWDTR